VSGPADDRQPADGYIAPEIGFDSLRDAAAAIRCAISGDAAGFHAILTGTSQPRHVAGMAVSIAAVLIQRAGLDDEAMNALLSEISASVGDFLLDQPAPGAQDDGR
jgi:hypothetical protein